MYISCVLMLLGGNVGGVVSGLRSAKLDYGMSFQIERGFLLKGGKKRSQFRGLYLPPRIPRNTLVITSNIAVVHLPFWRVCPYARDFVGIKPLLPPSSDADQPRKLLSHFATLKKGLHFHVVSIPPCILHDDV